MPDPPAPEDSAPDQPPVLRATGRRTALNLLLTAGSYSWSAILLVISVPILVGGLGPARYGVFVLASLVLGYAALLDLGLTPSVVRAIAMHQTTSDRAALSAIVGTALTLFIALGLVFGTLLFAFTPLLVTHLLHLPAGLEGDAAFVLQLTSVGFACNLALTLFIAVPQGVQRLDVFATRTIFLATLSAVGQIGAVKLGFGLRGVAEATLAVNLLGLPIFVLLAVRLLPNVSFRPRFQVWAVRQLAGFGAMKFISQLAWLVTFQLDRVIVAAFLPIAQVTYYAIPVTITQKFTLVQASFATAVFPAASELHAINATDRLQRLYLSAQKLMLVLTLGLVIPVALLAHPLMSTWIGPSFGDASAAILAVLAVGYGLTLLTGIPALVADATGRPHWTAASALASAVLNITLTLLLVPRLGAIGAAYALAINACVQGVAFILIVQRAILHLPLWRFLGDVVLRPAIAGAGFAVYALLVRGLITNFALLIAAGLVGLAVYAALTLAVGVLSDHEKRLVLGMLRSGRSGLGALLTPRTSG
jgi:O-antigen/teichoic acid export membrane protein